uniref:Uncharacterized protein n=1 Tax=Trichuris muris TaxID=70415 RepID=A0A5S6Q7M1_TRIMR
MISANLITQYPISKWHWSHQIGRMQGQFRQDIGCLNEICRCGRAGLRARKPADKVQCSRIFYCSSGMLHLRVTVILDKKSNLPTCRQRPTNCLGALSKSSAFI